MLRKAMADLVAWKKDSQRKPLVVYGARQVGKTWLVEEFGRQEFARAVTVNLDDRSFHPLFSRFTEPGEILAALALKTGTAIDGDTLLFLDEVQSCPEALQSLKYFAEKRPDVPIIAAGSFLGLSATLGTSFPVGKVARLVIRPLDFGEFLGAVGQASLAQAVARFDSGLLTALREDLIRYLRIYLCVGGMPEVVAEYVASGDLRKVRQIQQDLCHDYEQDMAKHPPRTALERMREVWDALPGQLAKENGRKFVYSQLPRKGGAGVYMPAIRWLEDFGLLKMVPLVAKPGVPLAPYADRLAFKLYALDVGLLGAKSGLDPAAVLDGDRLFTEFRGALTEQYVCQELTAQGYPLFYWSAEKSDGEVDFLTELNGRILPIEVKAAENLKAKSLKSFRDRYGVALSVRTSLSGTRDEGWLLNIPLYAIGALGAAIAQHDSRT